MTFLVSFQQVCTLGSSVDKSRSDLANLLFLGHSRLKVLSLWCECSFHSKFWPSYLFSMLPRHVHIVTLFIYFKNSAFNGSLVFYLTMLCRVMSKLKWLIPCKVHMSDGRAQCQQRAGEIGFLSRNLGTWRRQQLVVPGPPGPELSLLASLQITTKWLWDEIGHLKEPRLEEGGFIDAHAHSLTMCRGQWVRRHSSSLAVHSQCSFLPSSSLATFKFDQYCLGEIVKEPAT